MNNLINTILKHGLPIMVAALCMLSVILTGCREEVGCTNRKSDNYNPDAVRDDGSCVNARDKFLGIYSVLMIQWPDSLPDFENQLSRFMTVAEDQLREPEDDIKIFNFGMDSITVRGLVDKHVLTIPQQNLSVRGIPMTIKGEGHIDGSGYLTILYNATLFPSGQIACEDCLIFGQRLDN